MESKLLLCCLTVNLENWLLSMQSLTYALAESSVLVFDSSSCLKTGPGYGSNRLHLLLHLLFYLLFHLLQDVDFRGNNFGDNGAMILARSMRQMQNSSISKIDLGYNEIMDDGAFTLANVRCSRPSLWTYKDRVALQRQGGITKTGWNYKDRSELQRQGEA